MQQQHYHCSMRRANPHCGCCTTPRLCTPFCDAPLNSILLTPSPSHPTPPPSFDAVGGVSVEANNEAVGALAGIDLDDILMAQWRNSTYRPCHYVAIDRANQCVVVSIR